MECTNVKAMFALERELAESQEEINAEGSISLIGQRPIACFPKTLQSCKFIRNASGSHKFKACIDERLLASQAEGKEDAPKCSTPEEKVGLAMQDHEKETGEKNTPNTPTTNASAGGASPISLRRKFPAPLLLSNRLSPHFPDTEEGEIWSLSPKLKEAEEVEVKEKHILQRQVNSQTLASAFTNNTCEEQGEGLVDDEKHLDINSTTILHKNNKLMNYLMRKHNRDGTSQDQTGVARKRQGGHMVVSLSTIRKTSVSHTSTLTIEASEQSRRSHHASCFQRAHRESLQLASTSTSTAHRSA